MHTPFMLFAPPFLLKKITGPDLPYKSLHLFAFPIWRDFKKSYIHSFSLVPLSLLDGAFFPYLLDLHARSHINNKSKAINRNWLLMPVMLAGSSLFALVSIPTQRRKRDAMKCMRVEIHILYTHTHLSVKLDDLFPNLTSLTSEVHQSVCQKREHVARYKL